MYVAGKEQSLLYNGGSIHTEASKRGIVPHISSVLSLLQEVFTAPTTSGRDDPLVVRDGVKDPELGLEVSLQTHDGRDVTAAVAVVGR